MEHREEDLPNAIDPAAQPLDPPAPGPADTAEPEAMAGSGAPVAERVAIPGQQDRAARRRFIEPDRVDTFRARWTDLQARFVDDPRGTVEEADHLVAELFQMIAQAFSESRSRLEREWAPGELGTEDLRQLVHRYRVMFDALLAS